MSIVTLSCDVYWHVVYHVPFTIYVRSMDILYIILFYPLL